MTNSKPKLKTVSSNYREESLDSDEDIRLLQRLRRERTGDFSDSEVTRADYEITNGGKTRLLAALIAIGAIVKGLTELYNLMGW